MRQIKVALPSTYIKMLYNYLVISHRGVVVSQYLLYNLAGFEDIAEGFLFISDYVYVLLFDLWVERREKAALGNARRHHRRMIHFLSRANNI
jgi:hypothetical protein